MGELGECGVVGQGGVMSREPKPGEAEADPRGSYMTGEQERSVSLGEINYFCFLCP